MGRPNKLNPNAKKIYAYIREFRQKYGYMPTYEEILQGTGVGTDRTVGYQIDRLVKFGWLERDYGHQRAMRFGQPRDQNYIRIKQGDYNQIEIHKSLLRNDQAGLEVVRCPVGWAVVSQARPQNGDLVLHRLRLGHLHNDQLFPLGKPPTKVDPQFARRVVLLLYDIKREAELAIHDRTPGL